MAGGGTTARGAFRYPYQFDTVVSDIRDKLNAIGMGHDFERVMDDFIALMMDRDRALEDYTTAGYSTPFFTTVAADGSGNYTTIKAAIEAQPAAMAGQWSGYNTIIYVKPTSGGYLEGSLGAVTFPTGSVGVTIWAGPAGDDGGIGNGNSSNSYLAWQSGGWVKTNLLNLNIKGFALVGASSANPLVSTSSTGAGGNLSLNNCQIQSPLYNTSVGKNFGYVFMDGCGGTLTGGTPGDAVSFKAVNSSLTLGNITVGAFAAGGGNTTFYNCGLSLGSTCTFTGSFDGSGTGFTGTMHDWRNNTFGPAFSSSALNFNTSNIRFSGNVNGSSENGAFFGFTITFTDCGRGRNISQVPSYDYGTCSITDNHLTGNYLVINQRTDTGRLDSSTMVSGTYGSVTLNGRCINANLAINTEFNSCPVLVVSGDKNIVTATINKANQVNDGTPVQVSGNNNVVTFVSQGFTGSYTDTGSGNIVNATSGQLLGMTIADAKGDLLAAAGNDDIRRLAVGSNDQVLTADSTRTLGVKWADPFHYVFDAKGDLVLGTGDNTYLRLPIGLDGRHLRPDSSKITGVSWDYERTLRNRLTANQASLETDTSGWSAESGCTIARTTSQASHGSASLQVTKS